MSKIEVNTVAPQCGTTLTLGESGDTVTLGTGASQSGFGRTGTVDWQTTPKTGDFTAANGEGYFVNTTSGEITVTLPSASAGDIIAVQDYNNTFDSNKCVITAPSGVKINGGTAAGSLNLATEGQGLTLVYVDSTVGWRSVDSTTFSSASEVPTYITATGGTITTVDTNYKVHTFTGPGTFCISAGSGPLSMLDYMVVAGGGGGAVGGGGAGGFRESKSAPVSGCWTASPLASGTPLGPFNPGAIPVTVGAGGAGNPQPSTCAAASGSNSIFSTITSAGGGGAGTLTVPPAPGSPGVPGGSGGGGGGYSSPGSPGNAPPGGTGNTPPVSPAQGTNGGNGSYDGPSHTAGGGGGGATVAGTPAPAAGSPDPCASAGPGGAGATNTMSGSPVARAGGGGGGANASPTGGTGGTGGGGGGGAPGPSKCGTAGTVNTGGGGGGTRAGAPRSGGDGGSGVVMIRYKFQ